MKALRYVLAAAVVLLSGQSMAAVVNGGFESGDLPPWTCTGDACEVDTTAPHSGTFNFEGFDNETDGDLSQVLSTVAGTTYAVSAFVRTNNDPTDVNVVRLALGTHTPFTCATLSTSYAFCTASFVALTSNDPVHVYFKTVSGSGSVLVDDVTVVVAGVPSVVTPVPAVSDGALMALAALLMFAGWLGLRKRGWGL